MSDIDQNKQLLYDKYKAELLNKNERFHCIECSTEIYFDKKNIIIFQAESTDSRKLNIIYCKKCANKKGLFKLCSFQECGNESTIQCESCKTYKYHLGEYYCPSHCIKCPMCNLIFCMTCYKYASCACGMHKCQFKKLTQCDECCEKSHKSINLLAYRPYGKCRTIKRRFCCNCRLNFNKYIDKYSKKLHNLEHKKCICGEITCPDDHIYNFNKCEYAEILHPERKKSTLPGYHKLIDIKISDPCYICKENFAIICCECAETFKKKKNDISTFVNCIKCSLKFCAHHCNKTNSNLCQNCIL